MKRVAAVVVLGASGFVLLLVVEALLARRDAPEPFLEAPRTPRDFGEGGAPLRYVVMGDSTGAGQGAPYDLGIAVRTARHLATQRRVTLVNLSISGATFADVVAGQLALAARARPDVVLVSAGANDVTGLSRRGAVRASVATIADRLRAVNPEVHVILTAAPAVSASPRLAQPLRSVAALRTRQVNASIEAVARAHSLTVAPIAEATGPRFEADPTLFSPDRYHPDARGYAVWLPSLVEALDRER